MLSSLASFVVLLVVVSANLEVDWDTLANDVSASARSAYIADFEEVARQYVEGLGHEVSWWDIHAKHERFQMYPELKKYKIDVSVDRVNYGTVKHTVDRPGYVYEEWFHNSQKSQIIEGHMSKAIERQTSFTWSVEEGVKLGIAVTASAGVPEVFGASVSVNSEFSLTTTQSSTKTEIETFTISNIIKVDPQTSVKAEWTITEREMEVAWEADVHITGYVAIWFREQFNGHYAWFHPVWKLAKGPFHQEGKV